MSVTEIVAERIYQPNMVDPRTLFLRNAIDVDAALVEQLRGGEAEAVEALVDAYGDRVYRLALRITGNAADAEEVVQDALWTVTRKIDTFQGAAAFGSWVYRITANAAYQKLRERRSRRNDVSWDDIAPVFDEKGRHVEVAVDWSRRLHDPAIEGELKSMLCNAIDELPADDRTAFLLHDVEGLSNPEIAETLRIKLSTIRSRVRRARLFLRRRLADYMSASLDVAHSCRVLAEKEGCGPPGSVAGVIGMGRASHARHGGNVRTRQMALGLVNGVSMVGATTGMPVASPLPAGSPDRP